MDFNIITCINNNNAIGINNKLLYHIKEDLQYFKNLTINNVVIMGRKTYESLNKPLKNRINIIITHDKNYHIDYDNCYVVHSLDECIELCNKDFNNLEKFIIGGAKIYEEFLKLNLVKNIYLTKVNDFKNGDAYFPINLIESYKLIFQSEEKIDINQYRYTFLKYQK